MRFSHKQIKALLLTSGLVVIPTGCGSDDDSGNHGKYRGSAAGATSADEITDLNLSSALKLTIPELTSGGSSLALVNTTKSREACELENLVNEGVRSISQVAGLFCHLEIESSQLHLWYQVLH